MTLAKKQVEDLCKSIQQLKDDLEDNIIATENIEEPRGKYLNIIRVTFHPEDWEFGLHQADWATNEK